ncbi:MAG: response regulator [Chloroflexota bacterium]|nr:response regulator [Chloroflexota bacterium]
MREVPARRRGRRAERPIQAGDGVEPARSFSEERAFDGLIDFLAREAVQVMGADRSSIFLLDEERQELWSRIALGMGRREIRFPADRGVAGFVVRTGTVLNVPEPYEDPRFNRAVDRQTGYRARSILCAPLRARNGRIIGALQVLNKVGGGPFTVEDERLIAEIAGHCGIVIENALLYEQLRDAEEHGAQPRTTTPRLLCVEGDLATADRVRSLLDAEFAVACASDGAEALHLAMVERPDVMILSVECDRRDAFALCSALRRLPSARETPIIVLSASNRPEDVVFAFEAGANDYLPKPFAPAQLRAKAHTWLLRSARPS